MAVLDYRCHVPDVVRFAEYHVGLGEARCAEVGEQRAAAGALETAVVPISV